MKTIYTIEDITTEDISHFKYLQYYQAKLKEVFLLTKSILSKQRRSFLFENIRQHIVIQCNNNFVQVSNNNN